MFQRSFPRTPTWMMEGGAEFFAFYLRGKRGWAHFKDRMIRSVEFVHKVEDSELGIRDMEDIDRVEPGVRKYYRHLAYDAGAWAFAFMVHKSSSQSVNDVRTKFYPSVSRNGWEAHWRHTWAWRASERSMTRSIRF